MKKILSVVLSVSLLLFALSFHAFQAGAEEKVFRYYDKFAEQFPGLAGQDWDYEYPFPVYDELYYHETGGQTDWALIYADSGMYTQEICYDVCIGRAFQMNEGGYPFRYTYGVYNVAQERFFDILEITDESLYPDLQDVLDEFRVGRRIGETQYGENLRYKDNYLHSGENGYLIQMYGEENVICCYDEIYYHTTGNVTDWVLIRAETWFDAIDGVPNYTVVGDRVFRSESFNNPYFNSTGYCVYVPSLNKFSGLSSSLTDPNSYVYKNYPDLADVLDTLNLGEKIGDVNRDGKVNIRDVTQMQRCLAEFCDYPENDALYAAGYYPINSSEKLMYLSDINRDKQRSIDDATVLQRNLAEFDAPYSGSIVVNVAPDSEYFDQTTLRLTVPGSNSERALSLSATEAGGKQGVFNPLSKDIKLFTGVAYKLTIAKKNGSSRKTIEFVIPSDNKSNIVVDI